MWVGSRLQVVVVVVVLLPLRLSKLFIESIDCCVLTVTTICCDIDSIVSLTRMRECTVNVNRKKRRCRLAYYLAYYIHSVEVEVLGATTKKLCLPQAEKLHLGLSVCIYVVR